MSQKEIANNPDWFIRFLRCRRLGGRRCLHSAGLQCDSLQLLSAEAFALNIEYRCVAKDPVQGAQQGVILIEVCSPMGRVLVTGEDNIEVAFFVVSPVNQVKEQPGILFVELTVTHFINNQAGGAHEAVKHRCLLSGSPGGGELVPQLWHLNEIGLNAPLAALITKRLSQMGLTGSGRANECQVSVGIDG